MYKIGELSQLCGIPVKTLRYYDSEGLLVPDEVDRFTGYRYYSAAKLADCNRIILLKKLGFSLDEIREHLRADEPEDTLALFDAKQRELRGVIDRAENQLKQLERIRQIVTQGEKKMFDMVIKSSDSIHVAGLRRVYDSKADAYAEIERIRRTLPKSVLGRRNVLINYETDYRENGFDLTACVEVTGRVPASCGLEDKTITLNGNVAVLVCRQEELDEAYRAMTERLAETPAQIVGAFYEIAHEDGTVELKVPVCRLSAPAQDVDDAWDGSFENDPDAVGMWEFVDLVPSEEQYSQGTAKYTDRANIWLKKLCFLPGGKGYWIMKGWTKGCFFQSFGYPKHTYAQTYRIEERGGEKLMFVAMKDRWHTVRGGQPLIYVYRQIDSLEHTEKELRVRDNIDLPFISDDAAIGAWTVCDCVKDPEGYHPEKPEWSGEPFWKSVVFDADGKVTQRLGDNDWVCKWTKGCVIDEKRETASAYLMKEYGGKDYLFIEWKSGDYVYGGRVSGWYVFIRA
ncbi:MAG: MerR family transcriptional regulator [Clostridia bacterium]|nr:MerR family transcriptional regulator [Clostridia bacterium]